MYKLVRITTVPISFKKLLVGQMKFMSKNGFEVTMMSSNGPEVIGITIDEGCAHQVVPMTRKITPFLDLIALWILFLKIKKIKPNIVHTHTPKAGLIGMLAASLAGVPVRIHTVAGLPLQVTSGIKRKILNITEKITYSCASEVWPNSKSLVEFILNNKFCNESKIYMINKGSSNGIDVDKFEKKNLDQAIIKKIKASIDYRADETIWLFVGRVVKDKGIAELVKAFCEININYSSQKLLIVGPLEHELDPIDHEIMQLIENNNKIILVGYSEFISYYMAIANYFVFPSHREGFPNVLMQAALMELPVICSDIGGNIDIVTNNFSGLLFPVKNIELLVEQMKYAFLNPEEMKRLSINLKINIEQNYKRINVHNSILQRYKQLVNYDK